MSSFKVERTNIINKPEVNGILCDIAITDDSGDMESFKDVFYEVEDTEAFLVFGKTNEEVYINRYN
jgi:hypothetical protein